MILPHAPGLTSLKMHDDGYHEVNLSKGVLRCRRRKKSLACFSDHTKNKSRLFKCRGCNWMHVTNLSMHIRGDRTRVFDGEAGFDQLVVLLSR